MCYLNYLYLKNNFVHFFKLFIVILMSMTLVQVSFKVSKLLEKKQQSSDYLLTLENALSKKELESLNQSMTITALKDDLIQVLYADDIHQLSYQSATFKSYALIHKDLEKDFPLNSKIEINNQELLLVAYHQEPVDLIIPASIKLKHPALYQINTEAPIEHLKQIINQVTSVFSLEKTDLGSAFLNILDSILLLVKGLCLFIFLVAVSSISIIIKLLLKERQKEFEILSYYGFSSQEIKSLIMIKLFLFLLSFYFINDLILNLLMKSI